MGCGRTRCVSGFQPRLRADHGRPVPIMITIGGEVGVAPAADRYVVIIRPMHPEIQTSLPKKRQTYLLQDPYDDDAITYMNTMYTSFGLRPVCFYTNTKASFYGKNRYPILRSKAIEASFDVDLTDLGSFVEEMSRRYDVRAVIPYREDTVEVAARVLEHLDLDWNSATTLARFRDKHALKEHITSNDPSARTPMSRIIENVSDVFAVDLPRRFVIKPNNGMGSENLGFFGPDERSAIEAHLAKSPSTTWILEEYIDGPEFRINGLIRRDGTVQTLAIFEYVPLELSDHFTLAYSADSQVASTDDRFTQMHAYASTVLRATGLRGSPFHMEVKIDQDGPALIDLGARVASEGTGHILSMLHPARPDMYSVAAHDVMGPNNYALEPLDYTCYDQRTSMMVCGTCSEGGVIRSLHGIDEIESLPEFVSWAVKPEIGDPLRPTDDLRSTPYIVNLRHDGGYDGTLQLADRTRTTIRWNLETGPRAKINGQAANLVPRIRAKARWTIRSASRRLARTR